MTAVAVSAPAPTRPVARRTGPSLPALVVLEIRKSLSTRSGKALAAASVAVAPAATAIASASSTEAIGSVTGPLTLVGMLTAFVLISMGVLSTAGEWTHGSVQTTYLITPGRGRVLAAKSVAVAVIGAFFTAVSTALAAGVLAVMLNGVSWDGAGRVFAVVVAAGAVFAVVGAGVGAALGNTSGALTGLYMVILGVMPVLSNVKPAIEQKIDPAQAVVDLAQGANETRATAILVGWVVVSLVAGTLLTRRRAVQ